MTKESQTLLSSLANQREHVLGILEGLSAEDLQRPMLPSQWTCAGLVHHLAIDVEWFWFRAVVAGEPWPDDEPGNAWQVPANRSRRSARAGAAGRSRQAHPVRSRYKIASMIRRRDHTAGRPRRPGRSAGRYAAITCHWASVRSLG